MGWLSEFHDLSFLLGLDTYYVHVLPSTLHLCKHFPDREQICFMADSVMSYSPAAPCSLKAIHPKVNGTERCQCRAIICCIEDNNA